MQHALVFDSHMLPDGHLACPQEFLHQKNVQFKVFVFLDESKYEASKTDIELAAAQDAGDDFLSQEEVNYYLALDDAA